MPYPYCFQRLTAGQRRLIVEAHGSRRRTAPELAAQYGVAVRTIFRVLARAAEPVVAVHAGPWRTQVALTPEGPVQIEPWRPAS